MTFNPNDIFSTLLRDKKTAVDNWKGTPFEKMKYMGATEKSDLGEDFCAKILEFAGCIDVNVKEKRRGHFDVSIGERFFIEVKTATQDINKAFQFNGIRYDRDFSHFFCLGITPDSMFYLIDSKESLLNKKYHLVSMAKGTNAAFKLTRTVKQMNTFEEFMDYVKQHFLC